MFETSVVQARALAAQRRVGLASVSIAAHAAVIVGAIALSVAAVDFPTSVPRQMTAFNVSPPPPLGTPDGGRPSQPKPAQPQPKPAVTPPVTQITAPRDGPPTPTVDAAPSNTTTPGDDGPIGTDPGPFGRLDGKPGATGPMDQPPVVNASPEPTITIHQPGVGDVKRAHVLRRVDPIYPNMMRTMRMSATVRIHCVIGSDGRIRDPQIVVSSYPPFNNAVLQALDQWTFAPGTMRGQPVDTYFDLTVTFTVK